MVSQFLWVIVPYLALVLFVAGHIWRYQRDQLGWTSKSSELLEKKQLRLGSLLFHWGILFVFVGHVMGILIPEPFYEALGVTEETYTSSPWQAAFRPAWPRLLDWSSYSTAAWRSSACGRQAASATGSRSDFCSS
ncbi:Nitrate reductase-like protein NarX [Geobacillus sp. BCO2]|nr:Nitrate reductase-like protein NarX [Geobacillus sp. BCO2]